MPKIMLLLPLEYTYQRIIKHNNMKPNKRAIGHISRWLLPFLFLFYSSVQQIDASVFSVGPGVYVEFKASNELVEPTLYPWADLPSLETGGWRVLTSDEWMYLLVDAGGSGRTNANNLNALGRIQTGTSPATYQNGLIILPDFWVQPAGVPDFQTVRSGMTYAGNTYTQEQWLLMAAAGAVFLPCGGYGYMDGSDYVVEDAADQGSYWAKDEYSATYANCIRFQEDAFGGIHDFNYQRKTTYFAVCLVRDVIMLSENDEQATVADKLDALRAADKEDVYLYRTLRKAGCFNTLTLPFSVPDIQSSPLKDADVYTFTSATVENNTLILEVEPLTGSSLVGGTPYLIEWANTGEVLTLMHFTDVRFDNDATADDAGTGDVVFHGFYGKTHIADATRNEQHLNLFLEGGNQLYWPTDGDNPDAKMLGFRAWFQVTAGSVSMPVRKGMPAALRIRSTPTDIPQTSYAIESAGISKLLLNGHIIIVKDGNQYTLEGRKL